MDPVLPSMNRRQEQGAEQRKPEVPFSYTGPGGRALKASVFRHRVQDWLQRDPNSGRSVGLVEGTSFRRGQASKMRPA